ncbi:flagellar hook-associated protein FlgL [Clostridium cylindrosporum]|uniref:Flagellar hook-associated protein 3 n=1 Tax=Clostridium cylindrosporum DSM 605 TaxID=1121307 RepID=A0A0J8DBL9_CLOCY|nr:flagellar hook-associated protein FlgL [Clostridium cylindrosporum]KMT21688.1 flagellar hook-associated protein 3 [Clostridium cylindrosporum DSM 605]
MRVTQRAMVSNYLHNLNKNYKAMGSIQQQLATGHKVSKPSDNPFIVTRTMELKASIAANERYKQNIEEGIGWTDTQEMALGQINDVLQKVRELTVQGATGTNAESDKQAISSQLKQLKEQLVEIANTSYDGRYIFSGQRTTEKPFIISDGNLKDEKGNAVPKGGVLYMGSNEGLVKELSPGVSLDIGVNGQDFFKEEYTSNSSTTTSTDNKGIFATIDNIIDSLGSAPTQTTTSLLGALDKNMENISTIRSECGARQNRLEDMNNKNDSETYNMTTLLAKTYDIDLAETYTEAKVLESVYQASLNVGARVLQPSILDFLR